MADLDQSSSDVSSVDFKAKGSSEGSKLGFSEDEETLITIMYNLVGKSDERCCQFLRWSLIAGRVPGRTAEEIERHWTRRQSRSK